jgi:hypothetical protein
MALTISAMAGLLPSAAHAAEVQFEGDFRSRARIFDSLSLDHELATSEGMSWYVQHRLWLKPKFVLSDKVALFTEFRGLDNVVWGDEPGTNESFLPNGVPTFDHALHSPTTVTEPTDLLLDFTLWRVWGEAHTPAGTWRFGRVPLHWGSGIWLNDGLSVNPNYADFGDSTDRFQWEYLIQDQFFLSAALDTNTEGFVNDNDDSTAFNAMLAYRNETFSAGLLTQLEHRSADIREERFNLFTLDAAMDAQLGKLDVALEFLGQFGGGALPEIGEGVSVTAFGTVLDAKLHVDPWLLGVQLGLASGDGDQNDLRLKTFTFDRDFSVGMVLFEQPMPTLNAAAPTDANGGRSYDDVLLGNAVQNSVFVKPMIGRQIVDGLMVEASFLGARVAKVPEALAARKGYGMEFDAGVRYTGIPHFEVGGTFGAFLPGTWFKEYIDLEGNAKYDDPVIGAQILTRISF